MIFYHATLKKNLSNIRKYGLDPGRTTEGATAFKTLEGFIFLSRTLAGAKNWAYGIAEIDTIKFGYKPHDVVILRLDTNVPVEVDDESPLNYTPYFDASYRPILKTDPIDYYTTERIPPSAIRAVYTYKPKRTRDES